MHAYLRIILREGSSTNSEEDKRMLLDCLRAAPGMEAIREITPHLKGGYGVTMELSEGAAEAFSDYVQSRGYMMAF